VVLVAKARSQELQAQMTPEVDIGETPPVVETGTETPTTDVGVTPPLVDVPIEERYRRVKLVIAGVPAGKIADVNRGILMPINRAVGDFEFTIEIDVTSEEGLSKAELENTIKETVRQIGARVVEERVE
jgi:hypothetical protein